MNRNIVFKKKGRKLKSVGGSGNYQVLEEREEKISSPIAMDIKKEKSAAEPSFLKETAEEVFDVLLNLRQTGTVKEYRDLFEKLSDVVLRSIFVNGLREDVKAELSHFEAESLSDLMDLSEVAEARCRLPKDGFMRFWGKIEGRRVVVAVSNGSKDNFIAKRVVAELRLPTWESRVRFAYVDGSKAESGGLCKGLAVKVQGLKMEIRRDFYVVDLEEGEDIVLGRNWFSDMVGKKTTVKGDPSLSQAQVSIHRI
ncbi:hypothetical protein PIB30_047531 [Stylosanthes scabra]|uniref:Uncharacterized protein n=1 Tax=Stylosanthes scabra TaxID=79078 RepID=A0ABU6YFL9_9FABA|nr:hypothetical protein [Stylosanthes scabra]